MKHYLFEGIENFRDLGGYETPYGETSSDVLFRSGRLFDATEKDLQKIKRIGIRSIIDLRNDEDKSKYPSKTSQDPSIVTYLLPVNGNGRIPTGRLDQIESYLEMVEDPKTARPIFKTIVDAPKPLLIHCNAGKDRTGMFVALVLLANDVALEDIEADYALSFSLLPKLTAHTKKHHKDFSPVLYTPSLGFLERVLRKFFKKYKSLDGYFYSIGLSSSDVRSLHSLLGKQERSYGAVVYKDGRILLEHMCLGHYSLPKGHIEKVDKDGLACAKREILEETGLTIDIPNPQDSFDIVYSPFYGILKRVTFFRAFYLSGNIKVQQEEVIDASFVTTEEAMKKLTFESDKETLRHFAK